MVTLDFYRRNHLPLLNFGYSLEVIAIYSIITFGLWLKLLCLEVTLYMQDRLISN